MPDELFSSPPGAPDTPYTVENVTPQEQASSCIENREAAVTALSNAPTSMPSENQPPKVSMPDSESTRAESSSGLIPQAAAASRTWSESGLVQLFEKSFTSPEATKAAVASLIERFDDKGLWLSSLVQPAQLTAELRQECSELTTLILTQWVRQGETHKLKQLGDALLAEEPKYQTHEGARIMAVLAGLLGILRPVLAQRLLAVSAPRMIEPADSTLLQDARQWVEAGTLLDGCVPEERVFWNRRLREPSADWRWDTAEARMALGYLARKRPSEEADLELFQNTVPGCWWDLWRDSSDRAPAGKSAPAAAGGAPGRGSFAVGMALGVAAAWVIGWMALSAMPEWRTKLGWSETIQVVAPAESDAPEVKEPAEPALVVEEKPAPPIRESLRQLQALLKRPEPPAAEELASGSPSTMATAALAPGASTAAGGNVTKEQARRMEVQDYAAKHPDVARLVKMVKEGSFRENAALIQGGSSVAAMGSPAHRHMIHWLILDPPERADSRLVVTKIALRALPAVEIVPLFDLCYYAGSPNEIEIKECSQLLLELPIDDMKADDKARLQAIVGTP